MIAQGLIAEGGLHSRPTQNREQWLTHMAILLRPWFASRGYEIPLRIRLGVGALSLTRRVVGVCFPPDRDGFQHITISPFIDDPVSVAAILTHELIHAMLPADEIHGRRFAAAAAALGLEGRLTTVTPGPELKAHLEQLVRRIGPYPHKAVLAGPPPARQAAARRLRARAASEPVGTPWAMSGVSPR